MMVVVVEIRNLKLPKDGPLQNASKCGVPRIMCVGCVPICLAVD